MTLIKITFTLLYFASIIIIAVLSISNDVNNGNTVDIGKNLTLGTHLILHTFLLLKFQH